MVLQPGLAVAMRNLALGRRPRKARLASPRTTTQGRGHELAFALAARAVRASEGSQIFWPTCAVTHLCLIASIKVQTELRSLTGVFPIELYLWIGSPRARVIAVGFTARGRPLAVFRPQKQG
jgi:hypothetical protein